MTDALAHRGPDGRGVWFGDNGAIALGHRALHTTSEARREAQPIVRCESGLSLVADARIDNREELISTLGLSHVPPPTDGELILAAYERWGQRCAERLIGDFAFAVWDSRGRTLFCARDPLGVKPFYYFRDDRLFVFASELKALLIVPGVDPTIDPEQIALFLAWRHDERTRTSYRSILRLPAAHAMLVALERSASREYWNADGARDVRFRNDAEYVNAFREVFGDAVSARLRCDRQVGTTLSGGLDSSSIACMARHLRGPAVPPLKTFSVIFPDLPEKELRLIDERAYVDAVVRGGGIEPTFVRGDRRSPLEDVDRMVWHVDEPFSAPNLYLHWAMFDAAANNGVRVLLDGFDGDSAVSHGFGYLTGLARTGQFDLLATEVHAFGARHGKSNDLVLDTYVLPVLSDLARHCRLGAWHRGASTLRNHLGVSERRLARHALGTLMPELLRELFRHRDRKNPEYEILDPALARAVRQHERDATRQQRRRPALSEREAHVDGISQPLYQLTLEIADKCAAAFGVEPRYPFFDRRLIEFCVGIPDEQKFGAGWPRLLLRLAMDGLLPPTLQWRTNKANLSPNFHRQFRAAEVQRESASSDGVLAPYVRVDQLNHMSHSYRAAVDSQPMKAEALALFRITVLQAWLTQKAESTKRESSDVRAAAPAAA